jgi:asparagine synthetase B (glutamine-hydrolysing)
VPGEHDLPWNDGRGAVAVAVEALAHSGRCVSVADLAECFRVTCESQAVFERRPVVLSLSGGLDSRAVAAALTSANVPFHPITFTTSDGANDAELSVARRVAGAIGVTLRHRALAPATWSDRIETVELRDGLNDMAMAPSMEFLKVVRRDYGSRTIYFSGDGGDKVLRDLRAPWWARSFDDFVAMRLERVFWPLEKAADICGTGERTLRAEIVEHLRSYPERSARFRDVHFLMIERGMGWVREGEERNRSFLWHQTPFFSKTFFELAMSVDPRRKGDRRLRRDLIAQLQPSLADLPTSNPPLPRKFVEQIPPSVRRVLRRGRRISARTPDTPHRALCDELRVLLRDDAVREVFADPHLEEVLQRASPRQYDLLTTQVVNVARIWGNRRNGDFACLLEAESRT